MQYRQLALKWQHNWQRPEQHLSASPFTLFAFYWPPHNAALRVPFFEGVTCLLLLFQNLCALIPTGTFRHLRNRVAEVVRHPDISPVKGHAGGCTSHSEGPEHGASPPVSDIASAIGVTRRMLQ